MKIPMDSSLSLTTTQPETSVDSYPKFIRITKTKEFVKTRSNIPVGLPSSIESIVPMQMLNRPLAINTKVYGLSSTALNDKSVVDIGWVLNLLKTYVAATSFNFLGKYISARMTVRFIYEWSQSPAYIGKTLLYTLPSSTVGNYSFVQDSINSGIAVGASIIQPHKAGSIILDIPIHSPFGSVPMKTNIITSGLDKFYNPLLNWVSENIYMVDQNIISTNSTIKTFNVVRRVLISEFVPVYPDAFINKGELP